MVVCLIIYIVRTSFGGESYRVFVFWVSWEVFHTELCLLLDSVWCTNRSQNLKKSIPGGSTCAQIHAKISEKGDPGLPGDTLGAPRVHHQQKGEKREINRQPKREIKSHILHNNQKK